MLNGTVAHGERRPTKAQSCASIWRASSANRRARDRAQRRDILTANANDGNIVETTPFGAEFQPFETEAGEGGLFGLALAPFGQGVYFVNDSNNSLDLLH